MTNFFEKFAKESNLIEGEKKVTRDQVYAVEKAIDLPMTMENILFLHSLCGKHIKAEWVGKLRKCQVYIGRYTPPAPEYVHGQMETLVRQLPMMDSWQAHNLFEKIHPFEDLNGRVGRLIWLHKAYQEGYDFSISFLHKFYYQTLSHVEC